MKAEVLLIGAGQWIIDWCEYYNIAYTLIQKNELYIPSSAKQVVLVDYENDSGVWDYIEAICAKRNIVACLTSTEPALKLAAQVTDKYNLRYQTCEDIEQLKDKLTMRQVLATSPLNNVAYELVKTPTQMKRFVREHGTIIAKPQAGVGSLNVVKLTADDDALIDELSGYPLLAEKFIGGSEYSVEAFSYSGQHYILGIIEKQVDQQHFVEKQHVMPAPLSQEEQLQIEQNMDTFLSVMGFQNGPSHTEFKVEGSEIYFIETHNRVAGDDIASLLELVTGVNIYQHLIGWPTDNIKPPSAPVIKNGCAMIDFIFAQPGVITKISGVESSRVMPGVIEVKMYKAVGSKIVGTTSSYNRLGHILVYGQSKTQCKQTLAAIHDRLCIVIEPL